MGTAGNVARRTFDLGSFLNNLGISSGFSYVCPNRGCVVVDDGKVVYSWIGQDDTGSRPDTLPPIDEVSGVKRISRTGYLCRSPRAS